MLMVLLVIVVRRPAGIIGVYLVRVDDLQFLEVCSSEVAVRIGARIEAPNNAAAAAATVGIRFRSTLVPEKQLYELRLCVARSRGGGCSRRSRAHSCFRCRCRRRRRRPMNDSGSAALSLIDG